MHIVIQITLFFVSTIRFLFDLKIFTYVFCFIEMHCVFFFDQCNARSFMEIKINLFTLTKFNEFFVLFMMIFMINQFFSIKTKFSNNIIILRTKSFNIKTKSLHIVQNKSKSTSCFQQFEI